MGGSHDAAYWGVGIIDWCFLLISLEREHLFREYWLARFFIAKCYGLPERRSV